MKSCRILMLKEKGLESKMPAKGGPSVVTNGLILVINAADRNSWPQSGTRWYDLSECNQTFWWTTSVPTLATNPTRFQFAENAAFTGSLSPTPTNGTYVAWLSEAPSDSRGLLLYGQGSGQYLGAWSEATPNFYNGDCGSPTFYIDSIQTTLPSLDNKFHMWEGKGFSFATWTTFKFGNYGSGWSTTGDLAYMMLYNRILTSQESRQNYNALKYRFGN